jgi:predicted DNA-binding antitoxin AbrB/MazE fold protein
MGLDGSGIHMTIKAIYENGVFRPTEPVCIAEKTEVEVVLPSELENDADFERRERARQDIMEILSHSYPSGHTDTAERHNEHQP